jgi:hypothetical protein
MALYFTHEHPEIKRVLVIGSPALKETLVTDCGLGTNSTVS